MLLRGVGNPHKGTPINILVSIIVEKLSNKFLGKTQSFCTLGKYLDGSYVYKYLRGGSGSL